MPGAALIGGPQRLARGHGDHTLFEGPEYDGVLGGKAHVTDRAKDKAEECEANVSARRLSARGSGLASVVSTEDLVRQHPDGDTESAALILRLIARKRMGSTGRF